MQADNYCEDSLMLQIGRLRIDVCRLTCSDTACCMQRECWQSESLVPTLHAVLQRECWQSGSYRGGQLQHAAHAPSSLLNSCVGAYHIHFTLYLHYEATSPSDQRLHKSSDLALLRQCKSSMDMTAYIGLCICSHHDPAEAFICDLDCLQNAVRTKVHRLLLQETSLLFQD